MRPNAIRNDIHSIIYSQYAVPRQNVSESNWNCFSLKQFEFQSEEVASLNCLSA